MNNKLVIILPLLLLSIMAPVSAAPQNPSGLNHIALTFNSGRHLETIPMILDQLKANQIHATFFIEESEFEPNLTLIKRIINEQHAIGILTSTGQPKVKKTLAALTHSTMELSRIPDTNSPLLFLKPAHKPHWIVGWDVNAEFPSNQEANTTLNSILSNTHPGAILLCDTTKPELLTWIVHELLSDGYHPVTVPELIHNGTMQKEPSG